MVKQVKIRKVLRMGLPIVENLSGLCGNVVNLFRRPQLHFGKKKKTKKMSNFIKLPPLPLLAQRGLIGGMGII